MLSETLLQMYLLHKIMYQEQWIMYDTNGNL